MVGGAAHARMPFVKLYIVFAIAGGAAPVRIPGAVDPYGGGSGSPVETMGLCDTMCPGFWYLIAIEDLYRSDREYGSPGDGREEHAVEERILPQHA